VNSLTLLSWLMFWNLAFLLSWSLHLLSYISTKVLFIDLNSFIFMLSHPGLCDKEDDFYLTVQKPWLFSCMWSRLNLQAIYLVCTALLCTFCNILKLYCCRLFVLYSVRAEIGPMVICYKRIRKLVSWDCANETTQLTSHKVACSELLVLHMHMQGVCSQQFR
jgi:hypothetical protein